VFSVDDEIEAGLLRLVIRHERYSNFRGEIRTPEWISVVEGAQLAVERACVRDCERRVPGTP
jgi:hypothetical protein